MKVKIIEDLKGGLIVSCQVTDERGNRDPLNPAQGPAILAAFAIACVNGGAKGVRADGPLDINAIRRVVNVPIIGCYKIDIEGYQVRITPTFEAARRIAEAGADIIAIDATNRPRPHGVTVKQLVKRIKDELGLPVMADISTLEEGLKAYEAEADLIATTLSGHTSYTLNRPKPDLELVKALSERVDVPIIAEGHITTPELARRAIEAGAYAVVVGNMIVNPRRITEAFVRSINLARK